MLPDWTSALVAKAKIAAVMSAAVAAGGVGGTIALSHVAPAAPRTAVSLSSTSADPDSGQVDDPETAQAGDPETGQASDPETGQASDPETGQAGDPETGPAGDCAAGARNHGAHVSGVAHATPRGKGAARGKPVSTAARTDCGKKKASGAG